MSKDTVKNSIKRFLSGDLAGIRGLEGMSTKTGGKDILITVIVFLVVTALSFFFYNTASDYTLNIAMLYTLGVFFVTRYTRGYITGILFIIASVFSVNILFTYPFGKLNFVMEGYPVTFVGMFIIGIFSSATGSRITLQQRRIVQQEREVYEAQKEKVRANLLRAVSHDLRTPLTSIIGNSSAYLEMEDELSREEKRELISYIESDAKWLLDMVENLLAVTRIDNEGGASVKKSLEAADEVCSAAALQFKKRFQQAELKVKVPDELIFVEMDAMLIQQVIINLLQNAEIHAHSSKPIELSVTDENGIAVFSVRDYGIGINENIIDEIFEGTGYHGGESDSDGRKGMGIGLSICRTIITAHGGNIYVKPHDDGTEFYFTLPIKPAEDERREDVSQDIGTDN